MHHRSSFSLSKFMFSRYPLLRSSIPKSPILMELQPSPSNQCFFHRLLTTISKNARICLHPKYSKSTTQFAMFNNMRLYSVEIDRAVDEINLKFAEAREEIETAMDSKETVYFNEEAECARDAVKEVLELYEGLFQRLSEKEKGVIQRSMGLKIEQLKAELDQLNE